MNKRITWLWLLPLLLVLSGCFALQEAAPSSGQVVAPTLALATVEPATAAPTALPATDVPATDVPPTVAPTTVPSPTAEPSSTPEPTAEPTAVPASADLTVYQIDPARSEARFEIDEVLSGDPVRVVGVTSNVAGQVAFDLAAPAAAQIGTIVIGARDLRTDNNFRNNAIANRILLTQQHEFIRFTPTRIDGLPAMVMVGETYAFQVVGDLEMVGQVREVTFDASVTTLGADELSGTVTTTVRYANWGIQVPLTQLVSAVADEVTLALDFVAVAQP